MTKQTTTTTTEPRYEVIATYSNGIASAILDAPTTRDDATAKAAMTVGFMTGQGWTVTATIDDLRYVLDGPRHGCTIDVVRVYTTTAGDETIRYDFSDVTAYEPNYDGDGTARPVITLAKGVNMSAAIAIDRFTATDNDAVTSSERAALAVVVGSINAGDARIDAAGRVSIGAATIGRVIATHDEPTEPPPTEPKTCAHCGSTLGLDCGDAERDYDGDHCSHGCYALATEPIPMTATKKPLNLTNTFPRVGDRITLRTHYGKVIVRLTANAVVADDKSDNRTYYDVTCQRSPSRKRDRRVVKATYTIGIISPDGLVRVTRTRPNAPTACAPLQHLGSVDAERSTIVRGRVATDDSVAITFDGAGEYWMEGADGVGGLDLGEVTTADELRAAVAECIDAGTGDESWHGWATSRVATVDSVGV